MKHFVTANIKQVYKKTLEIEIFHFHTSRVKTPALLFILSFGSENYMLTINPNISLICFTLTTLNLFFFCFLKAKFAVRCKS